MRPVIAALIALAMFSVPHAQAAPLRARTTTTITFPAPIRAHHIAVSAPTGAAPAGGFPVIYVLDGDGWTDAALAIVRMREYEKLDPAIVVSVGYPGGEFFDAVGRSYDFSPPGSVEKDFGDIKLGGADAFLNFLTGPLRQWVNAHYKVDPSRQILFGHSMGGSFALYALFVKPQSFNVFLAASPDLPLSNRIVFKWEHGFESNPARKSTRALITVGGLESKPSPALEADYLRYYKAHPESHPGESAEQAVKELFADDTPGYNKNTDTRDLAARLAKSGAKVSFVEYANEEHMAAAISALNDGVPFALRPAR